MAETTTFLSADELSKTNWKARVYLATRPEDSKNLAEKVLKAIVRGTRHDFDNGYSVQSYQDGAVALIDPNCDNGKLFGSYEQFAAYYLAKFC